ncbi:MAG TPA: hypothetical protein VNM24_00620 [Burkholderiales bacterium]|nr:hypothetical protein [Burkholderiales bacterium]
MTWSVYRWTWRLESPLYVGTTPAGSLNRCRLYIPARTLWAALTAELARLQHSGAGDRLPDYHRVGEDAKQNFRLTYLYPAEKVQETWRAWLPRYEDGKGLVWMREDRDPATGPLPDREFRPRLLHTRPSTAIDPLTDTAQEGSLRETECVQPRWRDEGGKEARPVAFVGYILVKEAKGSDFQQLCEIKRLFVGGDTRYGLGRLGIQGEPQLDSKIFNLSMLLDRDDPMVMGWVVLAHSRAPDSMLGAREALLRWDMRTLRPLTTDESPLWAPGSCWAGQGHAATFKIDEAGIWHFESNKASDELKNGKVA